MDGARILHELKRDALGCVQLVTGGQGSCVRRLALGSRLPGSAWIARRLARREVRALRALRGRRGVPRLVEDPLLLSLADASGRRPRPSEVVLRSYIEGQPLHRARTLPRDFFDLLDALVLELHEAGVCHNDLHKEQNILVDPHGRPALIDFQLASRHRARGRVFRARVSDDLRHIQKHRRRYTRDGRGPEGSGEQRGVGHGKRRTPAAWAWRRIAKPLYLVITRGLLRTRDGEERRPSSGPWPEWTDAVGPAE